MSEQNFVWLFYDFDFERNYDVLKSKRPCILLSQNINFNKKETESKMENPPHTVLERRTLCFSSYKNRKLKVKLMSWSSQKRKESNFVLFILSEGIFFNICALPHCVMCWVHFQNVYTFTYQKTLFHAILCLFLKSSKAFSVSLASCKHI